jgi:uncharacterized protein (TIGR00288 family)
MLYDHRRPDVAVFIDFENVYVSIRDKLDANPNFETIMDRCNDLGRVVISRAYADWYRYPRITSALYANSIEPIYVPTYYYDKDMGRTGRAIKNSVDMNLCIDVMKTLYTNTSIGKFVLATGDRDFIPLVNSIRQQGKEVIVIGVGGAASTHLAQSADEFIFYEQLVGKPVGPARRKSQAPRTETATTGAAASKGETSQEPDIYNVLVDAVHLVRERGYVSTLGSLKLVMKELMGGDFKENRYRDLNGRPFNKFKDFVIDAEKRGKVQIFTSGTVNEVFLPGEDPLKLSQFAGDINEEPVQPDLDETISKNGYQQPEADTAATNNQSSSSTSGRSRRRRRPRKTTSKKEEQAAAEQSEAAETPEQEPPEPQEAATAEAGEPAPEAGKPDYEAMLPTIEPSPEQESQYEHLLAGLLAETEQSQDDTLFDQVLANAMSGKQEAERQAEETEAAAGETAEQDIVQEPELAHGAEASSQPGMGEQPAEAEPAQTKAFTEIEEAPSFEVQEAEAQEAAPAEAQEAEQPTAPTTEEEDNAERDALVFADEEWQVFREMMAKFSKPISFSQIVDNLKGLRNQGIISRTNEQLRTMGKQAIQNGMLNRSGRGSRIYYSLKTEDAEENGDDSG